MSNISDLYRYRVEVFSVAEDFHEIEDKHTGLLSDVLSEKPFRLGWFPSQAAAEEYARFFVTGDFPGVRCIEITYDTNVPPFYEGLIRYWLDVEGWCREYVR